MIARVLLLACLAFALPAQAAESPFRAELPVLVTSSGQSLAAFTTKTMLGRAGVKHEYNNLAGPDDLKPFKTVIIAMGASVKGFGAAGITAETELERTRALIAAARANKAKLIGVHIAGADGRENRSKPFLELVAPAVDYLIVWDDGDQDGFFTNVAKEKNIPLTLIPQPMAVGEALKLAFAP